MTVRAAEKNNDPQAIIAPTGLRSQITGTSCYFVNRKWQKKLLEQLKSVFKRTVKWNKYRSQMTIQSNNNHLNYLIDPKLTKVNRLFVSLFVRIAGEMI